MSEMNKRLNVEIGVTKKNKEDWIKVTTVVGGDTPEELDESIKAVQSRFKKLVALSLEMYEMMPAMEATPASPKQIEFIKSLRSNVNISYLGEAAFSTFWRLYISHPLKTDHFVPHAT